MLYFDASLEAVQLWWKWHTTHQQSSSHVGESHHQLLGLPLYLNGQLSGGGQDQTHWTAYTVSWTLKTEIIIQIPCFQGVLSTFFILFSFREVFFN